MPKKSIFFFYLVFLVCSLLVTGCFSSGKDNGDQNGTTAPVDEDFLVGEEFAEINEEGVEGYRGPWGAEGCFTLEDGAVVFDTSVPDAYITMDFTNDDLAGTDYQYAVVTLKTDKPEDAKNAHMKFGNTGRSFTDWGIELSDTYTTYAVDLWANGLTDWGDAGNYEPDFALNKVGAIDAVVYVSRILLTNDPPEYIEYVVGEEFSAVDGEGYWGPYGNFVLEDGALVFDTGIADAYMTMNFKKSPYGYQYAVVALKTDNPEDAAGATMTFGNVGQTFAQWGMDLSEDYTVYELDLVEVTDWSGLEFAVNKGEAEAAVVYLDKLVLRSLVETVALD